MSEKISSVELMLGDLRGVEQLSVGEWLANCPVHPWTRPTLNLERSGDVLLADCSAGCQVDAISRAAGWHYAGVLVTDTAGRKDLIDPMAERLVLMQVKAKQVLGDSITESDKVRAKVALGRLAMLNKGKN